MPGTGRIIAAINGTEDPAKLRQFMKNAKSKGASNVYETAFRRLVEILPTEAPGTIEHDFWRSIHAFEQVLSEERGKTVRLSRTRQKANRAGIMQTLIDFAKHPTSTSGFDMLIARGMPELTGEAIVLRHAVHFAKDVVESARARLQQRDVDVDLLPMK